MAIRHEITLSTTDPNNEIGLVKIRQADEETQTLVTQITENATPRSYEGLQVFFCAKLGQSLGLGIIEQKLNANEMTDPKNGKLEYTMRAEDWQQIGRQVGYFSFRKMTDDHTYIEQFTTRDFNFTVIKNVFSEGLKEVKRDGSTYVWTIEDLIRLFNEYMASGKSDWEEFVEQNKDIIEAVDPGGQVLTELITARGGAQTLGGRLDSEKAEFTAQLAQTEKNLIELTVNKSTYDQHKKINEKTVVSDDFATFGQAETGQMWTVDEGGFRIVEGGLQGTAPEKWNKIWIDTGLKDKTIELVVRSHDGSSRDVGFRISFRYADKDNYYYYGHRIAGDRQVFAQSVIDQTIVEDNIPYTGIEPTLLLKLVIRGNNITVYENGIFKQEFNVSDDFKNSTKVGLFMYGEGGTVSGFRVHETPVIEYPHNIIASVDNHMVAYDGNDLLYSSNGGANFLRGLNISQIGILKYIQLFSNGSVLFADDRKCYYSHDWKTYQESTLLNEDGSIFIAETDDTFYSHKRPSHKHIVNGNEIVVWGNYSISGGVQRTNNIRVWYSTDFGETVKCCYTANKPETVKCRHIHNVDYYDDGNFFILQTGDADDESHWVKGLYDAEGDTWSWEVIGSGLDFKSTNIFFHNDGYAYYSWDLSPGGVRKVPINSLDDRFTHELLFKTQRDCGYVLVGESGDILAFQTSGNTNAWRYYYSKNQVDFHLIPSEYPSEYLGSPRRQYNNIWPPDGNGKILAGVQSMLEYPSPINYFTRKEGHVWIDEQLKKFGFPNAMK